MVTSAVLARPAAPQVAVVVPCFNEEEVLAETTRRLREVMRELTARGKIALQSFVYLVDDGSRDRTWSVIESLASTHDSIRGIKLSRNRGHQNALLAGLLLAEGDVVISIDADLQDDVAVMEPMLDAHAAGSEIVYGVRRSRDTDTMFKRLTAKMFYSLLHHMGVDAVRDHADYRLMSRRAIEALREFREVNLYLRGILPQLGFPSAIVHYDRENRLAGETKYPLGKMLSLAWQGVTSFSAVPLRLITGIGVVVSLGSFAVTLWALWIRIFTSGAVPGWASTVLPIYFLGGIQLFSIGIIGEYMAKIYMETKGRPRYVIEKTTDATAPKAPA
jgi:glycosyltransferase involved in cell wall biosynthesis